MLKKEGEGQLISELFVLYKLFELCSKKRTFAAQKVKSTTFSV